jgi:hypothetical protein
LTGLKPFIETHVPGSALKSHKTFGLIMKEHGLYVSPDGVVLVSMDGKMDELMIVEIKTRVAITTQQQAEKHNGFYRRSFPNCHDIIETQHRSQILHQAAVMGLNKVLYTVATKSCIVYVVLVSFSVDEVECYLRLMKRLLTMLSWTKDDAPVFPRIPLGGIGGCPDQETLQTVFFLVKQMREAVIANGKPFPPAKRIVPKIVVMWNLCKGMTDTFSRCLKNIKPNFKSLHPYAFIWIRLIMTMMWNCHLVLRLFRAEETISNATSITLIHEVLNKVSSFQDSILEAALCYKITCLDVSAPVLVAEGEAKGCGSLTDESRNATKLSYLNSEAGTDVRRTGIHIAGRLEKQRKCIFCNKKTLSHCVNCSVSGVYFPVCTTDSYTPDNRLCPKSCFERLHGADKVKADQSRKKRASESLLTALRKNAKIKRKKNKDGDDDRNDDDDDDDADDDGDNDEDDHGSG